MQKPKAIIFDSDGTLFNTFELIVSAYKHVANTHELREPTPEEVRAQLGKALPDIFMHFYPDANIESLLHTNNEYVAANAMKSEAFQGVADLLKHLQGQGLKLGVLTSGSVKVLDILGHHKLDGYFSSVVHHERVKNAKPDPEGFLLACDECEVTPQEAIMIGDTTVDIQTGKNARALATIAVTHGTGLLKDLQDSKPTYITSDIAGIRRIITPLIA